MLVSFSWEACMLVCRGMYSRCILFILHSLNFHQKQDQQLNVGFTSNPSLSQEGIWGQAGETKSSKPLKNDQEVGPVVRPIMLATGQLEAGRVQLQGLSGLQSEFKISLGNLEKTLSQSELNIRIEFTCLEYGGHWISPQFQLSGAETGDWENGSIGKVLVKTSD